MTITAKNLTVSLLAAGLIALTGPSAFAAPSSRLRTEHFLRYHHHVIYRHTYRLGGGAAARSNYCNPWATDSQLVYGRPQGC
jgi:hypothetical protein